jgi:hypothetical protein
MPVTTGSWQTDRCVAIDNVLDDATWDGLLAEANEAESSASSAGIDRIAARRDGSFVTYSRFRSQPGGPIMKAVLRSREVLGALREATGLPRLIPVRCGYNYYRPGDFLGLHRDEVKATVTVLLGLTDNLGHTTWAPTLRKATSEDLLELVRSEGTMPDRVGVELPVRHRGLQAFDGYNTPHWRQPFGGELGILGQLVYFDL